MDIGVIGTGVMGRNHVRIYSEMKSVNNVTLFDLNTAAAKELADKHGVAYVNSAEELLNSVDAVSICVPTEYHFSVAKQVAEAGVHMLIEKPICLTSKQAGELIRIIPDDIVVGVGHIERFNPIINEISAIVKDPLYVEMKRHNPASSRITGSSVVEDLMVHDIDIVLNRLFAGKEYTLTAHGNNDLCGTLLRFDDTPVYLSASRKSSKKIRMIYIEEEDCTIEGNFMSQEVYIYRKPERYSSVNERYVQENLIEKVMVNKLEPLKVELSTFVKCAASGRPFPITPEEATGNLRMCEEIKKSCVQ